MELCLNPEEAKLVREILSDRHSELFREISRAQHHQFKTALRQKEAILDSVVRKLDILMDENCATVGADPTLG